MRNKILAVLTVALLVAAAFFLPERLLVWGDRQLLDSLHMESRSEEREGFAESIQLTVPEKILLLRGGKLTLMELDRTVVERAALQATGEESGPVVTFVTGKQNQSPVLKGDAAEELEQYTKEAGQLWEARLESLRGEIRSLQSLGGLPELWKADSSPDYTGYGGLLYLDPDTHINFQVYQISLRWEGYSLDLLVDAQSERILSFSLDWTAGGQPNWGLRGASNFGSAWRDYWKMDSVSTGWYNEYTRNVLENVEAQLAVNGDYAAYDQITFMYDGQSLAVPLECRGAWSRNFVITWNR